jgi:hypothetical protein
VANSSGTNSIESATLFQGVFTVADWYGTTHPPERKCLRPDPDRHSRR